jgi:WD40 repeat protein
VSASVDKEIRVWNVNSHDCERKIKGSNFLRVFGVKWIQDRIISAGADQIIRIFDPTSGWCESAMSGKSESGLGVYDVSWSCDGKSVVSGSRDRSVQIWDAESGLCKRTLIGHTNWVYSVN